MIISELLDQNGKQTFTQYFYSQCAVMEPRLKLDTQHHSRDIVHLLKFRKHRASSFSVGLKAGKI